MTQYESLSDEFGVMVRGGTNNNPLALDHEELFDRLRSTGVLLFRGFAVDERIFREFTELHGTDFVAHHNISFRDYVENDHTYATVARGQHAIDFHFEMASSPISPDVIWMYCVNPAESRGRTGLVDGVQVFRSLPSTIRTVFEEHGHYYLFNDVPPEVWEKLLPWVEGRAGAEQWLDSRGQSVGVTQYHFDDEDRLTLELHRCPIRQGKFCEQPVFVTGMLDTPSTPLGRKQMPHRLRVAVCQAMYQHAIWIDWQPGDVVLIDNTRVMHAREAFEDTRRRILIRYSALRPFE